MEPFMNLAAIQADMYRRLRYNTTPETVVTTRLTAFINECHREILGMKGMSFLRRSNGPITFQNVISNPIVSIPQAIDRIITIQDRTRQMLLTPVEIQEIRFTDPGMVQSTANPYQYSVQSYSAATAQDPSAAAALFAKSDSASDTSTKTAYLEGIVTGGYYQTTSIALNGTTAVQFPLSTWIAVTKFYIALSAGGATQAAGNIKLLQTSGSGTELSRIPPGADYARYLRLYLWPKPSQINTYDMDCELHVQDMATAGDEPMLPEDFHWVITAGAMAKEWTFRERLDMASADFARYGNGVGDLKLFLARRSGAAYNQTRQRRYSQLGGNFPVGS